MKKVEENNVAFIDGQNLHLGTIANGWKVDYIKLRIYLKDKYAITEANYFLGYIREEKQDLYDNLQKAGFILQFKVHHGYLETEKKGNVDTDIVFEVMKNIADNGRLNKVLLISGDGDYSKMVDYLIVKNRFKKILLPNKRFASSLYKKLGSEYFDYLENNKTSLIHTKNEKGS